MQTYKAFLRLALSKLPSALPYFIVFVVVAILISKVSADPSTSQFEVHALDICILDEDQSETSRALTEYLGSIHKLVDSDRTDREYLQDMLFYQEISYVLTIPEGFEKDFLSAASQTDTTEFFLLYSTKREDSSSGFFVDRQIDDYLNDLALYLNSGKSVPEAAEALQAQLSDTDSVTTLQFDNHSVDDSKDMYYFFQYLPYVFLMILLESLTPILTSFHRDEVRARIACSSLSSRKYHTQLAICCGAYSLLIWLAFLLVGIFLYRPEAVFSTNGLLCVANSFLFMLITVAITLLLGVFSLGGNALNMISNIIGLGMSFLCGIFVPQYYLSESLLTFSRFLPAYWYIRIVNMVSGFSNEALSMKTYWSCMGIQALFLVAIFAVYLVVSRKYQRMKVQ